MASLYDQAQQPAAAPAAPPDDASAPPADDSGGGNFTPKDPRQFVTPEQADAAERVAAAGMKLMYSPEMADERQAAVQSPEPVPKLLADNVLGLMLTLDQRSKGGLPQEVLFPAAVLLDNEAANMLVHAGKTVSQTDYNESLQILYVQIGKKLGASDDHLMKGAQDALAKSQGGMAPEEQTAGMGAPVAPDQRDVMPQNAGQAMPPVPPPPGGPPQ